MSQIFYPDASTAKVFGMPMIGKCLRYAHEHGCPWTEPTCKYTVQPEEVETCELLERRITSVNDEIARVDNVISNPTLYFTSSYLEIRAMRLTSTFGPATAAMWQKRLKKRRRAEELALRRNIVSLASGIALPTDLLYKVYLMLKHRN